MKLVFSRQILEKILKYQISGKIHPVGGELFIVNGRTDRRDKGNNRFSQSGERA